MGFDDVKSELAELYRNRASDPNARLTEDDLQRWSSELAIPRSELYDRIAMFLAEGFHRSELGFEFCDSIKNDLHGVITLADEERPELFWSVYLAFDEGEYYHGNNPEEDPVEAYTRPQIADILQRLLGARP
jgi:hypothetical protein